MRLKHKIIVGCIFGFLFLTLAILTILDTPITDTTALKMADWYVDTDYKPYVLMGEQYDKQFPKYQNDLVNIVRFAKKHKKRAKKSSDQCIKVAVKDGKASCSIDGKAVNISTAMQNNFINAEQYFQGVQKVDDCVFNEISFGENSIIFITGYNKDDLAFATDNNAPDIPCKSTVVHNENVVIDFANSVFYNIKSIKPHWYLLKEKGSHSDDTPLIIPWEGEPDE